VGFSCGEEHWSRHVGEWIRGSDVLDSISDFGTRVWLFETKDGEIVGFGSVGWCRWRWPLPDGTYTKLVMIPMLGIDEQFRGKPEDPNWRYSLQIMSHLIYEARCLAREEASKGNNVGWLVLLVHRDNRRAIQFYEKCGFELIPGVVRRNDHVVMKLWIGEADA
jgi:GNAT superfamily N-acetyltransferase